MFTIENVRLATESDFETVAAIFAHYVDHTTITFETVPPTVAQWRLKAEDLRQLGLPFLVAEVGTTIAGYAYAAPWRPKPAYRHTVENTVYLAPEQTGKGLGGLLLDALIVASAQAGARQMIAVVAGTGDPASAALHRSRGFTEAGVLRAVGRKHDQWLDTHLFQRDLGR